jgi:TolA-binding protein
MRLCVACALLMLGGCSYLPPMPFSGDETSPPEPTLASLEPIPRSEVAEEMPALSLVELESAYREVLAVTGDPGLQLKVRRRLAGLEVLSSEAGDDGLAAADAWSGAIAAYQALLQDYPDAAGRDQLLYQMARAQDMNGQGDQAVRLMEQLSFEYPDSGHVAEAEFRKGEAYFGEGDYRRAEQAYARVVQADTGNDYFANSMYMLGWSRFKQDDYAAAVQAFIQALDHLMVSNNQLDQMPRGDREMAADCFRVLAVIFSYQGGSDAIAASFRGLEERPYQYLVYESLGQLYLEQERYQDSAETFAGYISQYPESPVAHEFQWNIIGVYETAGFPGQVISGKVAYVQQYSVTGSYWEAVGQDQRALIRPRLQQYIDELARHYHSLAQGSTDDVAREYYLGAAKYYATYVQSFPLEENIPTMILLMAEAREGSGDYRRAIADYEWMAYEYPQHQQAAEAGYAAILAHLALASEVEEDRLALIDSQLAFARVFTADPRAPVVLGQAATRLLQERHYPRAVQAAADLVAWQPYPGDELVMPAWLVIGHGEFEQGDYPEAEQAYLQALALMPEQDSRQAGTMEQLASSIYRQGELAAASGQHLAAADHFARVIELTPDSDVRVNAQYDAAISYRQARDLDHANALFRDFRERYPGHELSGGIAAILVENYEAAENWQAAALELDGISASSDNTAVQREALYLSAQYYMKAGNTDQAIARYRSYAHNWPEPLEMRIEAMLSLADIYASESEPGKRHFWLNAMADAHESAGPAATDRSRYLAASSASELADWYYDEFQAISLGHPLKETLRRKRKAMDRTISGYERVNSYGLQEFGTRATYRLGQVYRQLSIDLMASERPAGLDALALEQYELLLEEQAWPFEEKAISIHEANARRAWQGMYDEWIESSFTALAHMMPARWGKQESRVSFSREIR